MQQDLEGFHSFSLKRQIVRRIRAKVKHVLQSISNIIVRCQ